MLGAERGVGGWLATIEGAEETYEDIFLPLHGRHQLVNLANAIAATEALVGRKLDAEAVSDAAAAVTIPGRLEPLGTEPLLMVDGAHNLEGIGVLVDSLLEEFPTTRWRIVFGVMGDKNVEGMIERLSGIATGFGAYASGEELDLLRGKRAVEQIEGLQRRGARGATGGNLAAVGTVERAECVVELHPRLLLVNHPSKLGRAEVFFRRVDLHIVRVRFE